MKVKKDGKHWVAYNKKLKISGYGETPIGAIESYIIGLEANIKFSDKRIKILIKEK